MSGPERKEGFDSLLDLIAVDSAIDPCSEHQDRIEIVDNTSPTLPPDKFRQAVSGSAQIIVEQRPLDSNRRKEAGVPEEKMPVGQEETTQEFDKFDPTELYNLELQKLFDKGISDKVTRLLG